MFFANFDRNNRQSELKISIVGGSNSVMRRGYTKYLKEYLSKATKKKAAIDYYSLGGVPSIHGVMQQDRYDIASQSDIIFFEYRGNDRYSIDADQYSLDLSLKSVEGFIRKVQKSNPQCIMVLILFGTNLEEFYSQPCPVAELHESIGAAYNLPTINITKLLSAEHSLDFVKSLYNEKDHAHYTRPDGVKVVSQRIVDYLSEQGIIDSLTSNQETNRLVNRAPLDLENFENLKFFSDFKSDQYFLEEPNFSVYRNTVFKEENYTFYQGNALNFELKGRLMSIFIKSDLSDGFIKIKFGSQTIVTSSYNSWVNMIKPQNVINMISLPMHRFSPSADFAPVSISLCSEYPQDYEMGFNKALPTKENPDKWKLSVIGIAYIGELQPAKKLAYSHR